MAPVRERPDCQAAGRDLSEVCKARGHYCRSWGGAHGKTKPVCTNPRLRPIQAEHRSSPRGWLSLRRDWPESKAYLHLYQRGARACNQSCETHHKQDFSKARLTGNQRLSAPPRDSAPSKQSTEALLAETLLILTANWLGDQCFPVIPTISKA